MANTTYDRGTSVHNGVSSHAGGQIYSLAFLDQLTFLALLIRYLRERTTPCVGSTVTAWHRGAIKVTSFATQAMSTGFMNSTSRDTTPPWFNMWSKDGKTRQYHLLLPRPHPQAPPQVQGQVECRPARRQPRPQPQSLVVPPLAQLLVLLYWDGLWFCCFVDSFSSEKWNGDSRYCK